jgi:catechol 2,3-dioxygenase-like lactoylglutathione lyase family enzyme
MPEDLVSVRYMVNDVQEAIDFYTRQFGFELRTSALPAFADVVSGPGGQQILLEDPSGNPIELFQPAAR